MKKTILYLLLLLFTALMLSYDSYANHCAGGEISYEWLHDSTYNVRIKFYRDCSGIAERSTLQLCFTNSCDTLGGTIALRKMATLPNGMPNGAEVGNGCPGYPSKCTDPLSVIPGYIEWWYEAQLTLPSRCDNWRLYMTLLARNQAMNLKDADSWEFYLEAILNNKDVRVNSSPVFTVAPVPYVCINQPYSYNNGVVDPDNDSLAFEAIMPRGTGSGNYCSNTTIDAIFNVKSPPLRLPDNPFETNNTYALDNATGNLKFTPAELGPQTVTFRTKEYRKGKLIGSVIRDIQVQVMNCALSAINVTPLQSTFVNAKLNGDVIEGCLGKSFAFCFNVIAATKGTILVVTDNHLYSIPDAKIIYGNQANDTIRGCFSWSPKPSDTTLKILTVTVKDSTCTAPGIAVSQTFTIPLLLKPSTTAAFDLPSSGCVGQEVRLLPKQSRGSYHWNITDQQITDTTYAPQYKLKWQTTGLKRAILHVSTLNGCTPPDDTATIFIHENPPADISFSGDVCLGDKLTLNTTSGSDFTYIWGPGEYFETNNFYEATMRVEQSTKVFVDVSNRWGCSADDSIDVTAGLCCKIFMPDAFSPNGDGHNDTYHAVAIENHTVESFMITNRWGQVVFSSIDSHEAWNGNFKHVPQPIDTYFYYIKYKCEKGDIIEKKGSFVLLR